MSNLSENYKDFLSENYKDFLIEIRNLGLNQTTDEGKYYPFIKNIGNVGENGKCFFESTHEALQVAKNFNNKIK